jgi:hypothetical protein
MPRVAQPCAALLLSICMASERAEPAQPVLTITAGVDTKHFTVGELLSRADLTRLEIPPNVDYKFSLTVKAVPLLNLLAAIPLEGFDERRKRHKSSSEWQAWQQQKVHTPSKDLWRRIRRSSGTVAVGRDTRSPA